MIILRTKTYSRKPMLDRIIAKLDKEGIQDYDTSTRIPKDVVSINTDLDNLKIYLPLDYEYNQYDIDNYIRSNFGSFIRTNTKQDRDIYVMTLSTKLNENQFYKLVKYIIEISEFVVLIEN
jgi:hypothetical protein